MRIWDIQTKNLGNPNSKFKNFNKAKSRSQSYKKFIKGILYIAVYKYLFNDEELLKSGKFTIDQNEFMVEIFEEPCQCSDCSCVWYHDKGVCVCISLPIALKRRRSCVVASYRSHLLTITFDLIEVVRLQLEMLQQKTIKYKLDNLFLFIFFCILFQYSFFNSILMSSIK